MYTRFKFQVTRYNDLLKEIKSTVTILEKGIAGQAAVSSDLENTLRIIYEGKVPDQWLKSIIANLQPRVK